MCKIGTRSIEIIIAQVYKNGRYLCIVELINSNTVNIKEQNFQDCVRQVQEEEKNEPI